MLVIQSMTVQAASIVVLGDSISAGYGIDIDQGWVNLLQKKLLAENRDYTIHNESISGDTTAGGLARIDQALAQHKPQLVIVELGANDGLRGLSPKLMKANLTAIIKRTQDTEAKVLLLSMKLPTNYGKRYTEMFYAVYPQVAEQLHISYVPFILEDIALNKSLMQKDRLHPNAEAQPLLVETVWRYLEPLLEQ